jgi:hypothetical protein
MINSVIDPRVTFGTAANQVLVWNPTTKVFDVSTTLSGLTLASPIITGNFSWTGNSTLDCSDAPKSFSIIDDSTIAWVVKEGGNTYIDITTSNGVEAIAFGNTTTNPAYNFLGSGTVSIAGDLNVGSGELLVDVDGNFVSMSGDVNVSGHIGVATAATAGAGVTFSETMSESTNSAYNGAPTLDSSAVSNATVQGAIFSAVINAAGSNNQTMLRGVSSSMVLFPGYDGTIADVVGSDVALLAFNDSTITNFHGLRVGDVTAPGGTGGMGTYYGANIGTRTNMTTAYGVYLNTSSGVTNDWSIYSASTNSNMAHVGNVRIGDTTVPTDALEVNGVSVFGDGGTTNYTQFSATGDITQNGTGRTLESQKYKLTAIGGLAIKLTNKTGANTVAGQLVKADTATDDAVILTAADDVECFGVFLDAGVADGSEAWVVVSGIADVAMKDNTAATHGNWVETSSEAGYADATSGSPVAAPGHFDEIGHCIESVSAGGAGTHILARCVLHFN